MFDDISDIIKNELESQIFEISEEISKHNKEIKIISEFLTSTTGDQSDLISELDTHRSSISDYKDEILTLNKELNEWKYSQ